MGRFCGRFCGHWAGRRDIARPSVLAALQHRLPLLPRFVASAAPENWAERSCKARGSPGERRTEGGAEEGSEEERDNLRLPGAATHARGLERGAKLWTRSWPAVSRPRHPLSGHQARLILQKNFTEKIPTLSQDEGARLRDVGHAPAHQRTA